MLALFHLLAIQRARGRSPDEHVPPLSVHVLLPAFGVAPTVAATVAHFSRMQVPRGVTAEVAVITTDREGSRAENPTAVAVEKSRAQTRPGGGRGRVINRPRIVHHHSTRRPFSKAAQLNDYIAVLPASARGPSTWFVVYDFDGRPEVDMINRLAAAVGRDPKIDLFQQVTLTIRDSPREPATVVARLDARGNLHRVLCYETRVHAWRDWLMRHLRLTAWAGAILLPVPYAAGNGVAVNALALQAVGGFPEPVDDIGLGLRLAYSGRRMSWLPTLVPQSLYRDLGAMTKSKSFIYGGIMSPLREWRYMVTLGGISAGPALLQASKALWAGITWPASPIGEVLASVGSESTNRGRVLRYLGLTAITQAAPMLVGQLAHRQLRRAFEPDTEIGAMPISDFLVYPLRGFANALGPWDAILRSLRHLIRNIAKR